MEPKIVLTLLDLYWYDLDFFKTSKPTINSKIAEIPSSHNLNQTIAKLPTIHTKSPQLETMCSNSKISDLSESPSSVLLSQNVRKTMFFGNETEDCDDSTSENSAQDEENIPLKRSKVISSRKVKSLSDLEFEELKGFMDLGFVFTIKDKDSTLASIIPGLQRLGNANEDEINNNNIINLANNVNIVDDENASKLREVKTKCAISRPYLSEAWEMGQKIRTREMKKEKEQSVLNLKVPDCTNQIDMKSYIKIWARNVASMVR